MKGAPKIKILSAPRTYLTGDLVLGQYPENTNSHPAREFSYRMFLWAM
jgi:hypothetical protein